MNQQQRADIVLARLSELYPDPSIPLAHRDPFTLLVAVVLSAQCTDKKVNEVTPKLFSVAPTAEKMLDLGQSEILRIIRPIGLSASKSKHLYQLSQRLVAEHGGEVPQTFEELEVLAGVGHKTASVVMAQAFGEPAFPVDTHIHRLAQRWGFSNGKSVIVTENQLKKIFPIESWNTLHLQIIYYGREHCTARGCDGTKCGLCRELFPNRKRPMVCRKA